MIIRYIICIKHYSPNRACSVGVLAILVVYELRWVAKKMGPGVGSRGIPWGPVASRGVPLPPVGSHGIPWGPVASRGVPWPPVGSRGRGLPWGPNVEFHYFLF